MATVITKSSAVTLSLFRQTITANATAGASSGIWYVYFANGPLTLTLPDATGPAANSVYDVNAFGTGLVTVACAVTGQTINGSTQYVMQVDQSQRFISNSTGWRLM